MLDRDIAGYFGVETKALNRAMKRNIKRFPEDFCFQLTDDECSRCQIGTLNGGRRSNIKYKPFVYSEQGVAMHTSALHTDRAVEASVQIINSVSRVYREVAFARLIQGWQSAIMFGAEQGMLAFYMAGFSLSYSNLMIRFYYSINNQGEKCRHQKVID